MAITKTPNGWSHSPTAPSNHYVGRVIELKETTETRNWSDTMDYSDFRSTRCTYALVWLGTRNVPPTGTNPDFVTTYVLDGDIPSYMAAKVRDLEFHEQFAWVDCTNIFSDRNGYGLVATVDANMADGTEPLMWANYMAWEAFHTAARAERARKAEAEQAERAKAAAAENAKKAAREAKKAAKEAESKAAAEALMAATPAKGTRVTVNGFTGTVFWKGVSKYYGKWNARVGVKDARGTVQWIDAAHWAV